MILVICCRIYNNSANVMDMVQSGVPKKRVTKLAFVKEVTPLNPQDAEDFVFLQFSGSPTKIQCVYIEELMRIIQLAKC